jgi:hypothetical protein
MPSKKSREIRGNVLPEKSDGHFSMGAGPVDFAAVRASLERTGPVIDVIRNQSFHIARENLLQQSITECAAPVESFHVNAHTRFFNYFRQLPSDMVVFNHHETTAELPAGHIPLPCQNNPVLLLRPSQKIPVHIPPVKAGIITENPEPAGQCSQIDIGCKFKIRRFYISRGMALK